MTPAPAAQPTDLTDAQIGIAIKEAYALHHLFFNLGFEVGEVRVGSALIANTVHPGLHAIVVLHAQGKEWIYTLARLSEADESHFGQAWTDFAERQPMMSRAELDALVEASEVRRQRVQVMLSLLEKGFVFPADFDASSPPAPVSGHASN